MPNAESDTVINDFPGVGSRFAAIPAFKTVRSQHDFKQGEHSLQVTVSRKWAKPAFRH